MNHCRLLWELQRGERITFPDLSAHLSSKQQSTHTGAWQTEVFWQDCISGLCSCARQLPGHSWNTPWNVHPASTGAKPGSRLSHAALCSHFPTLVPTAMGTGSSPQPHSAGMVESGRAGQSCRGTVPRGKEREGPTKQAWITPAYCTFPRVDNNSTYNLSCPRAPPACLQRARFSGRRGWGLANNYI